MSRERYERELRPHLSRTQWHDKTLELWLEAYFECSLPHQY